MEGGARGGAGAAPSLHYPRRMVVLLVVTEQRTFLDPQRSRRYERVRRRLEQVAGAAVQSRHYEDVETLQGAGAVVLSGSSAPWAAHDVDALERLGEAVRAFDGPVLGICAGMQLQAMFAGGSVAHAAGGPERGYEAIEVLDDGDLLGGLPRRPLVYQRHTDEIAELPESFRVLARSQRCPVQAIVDTKRTWWRTQFHPERSDAEHPAGERVLRNFFELAGVRAPA